MSVLFYYKKLNLPFKDAKTLAINKSEPFFKLFSKTVDRRAAMCYYTVVLSITQYYRTRCERIDLFGKYNRNAQGNT